MNTLSYIKRLGIRIIRVITVCTVLFSPDSCDSMIYEEEEDCSVYYRLKFRYDMNLKFADAFPREVKSVRLYAFNTEGKLVWQATEKGEALASEDYTMRLDLAPGNYRLVAWCGLEDEESFSLPDAAPGCRQEDLHCRLNREYEIVTEAVGYEEKRVAYSDKDLCPLFHGILDVNLPADDDGGEYTYVISLTKDSNIFRVVLQHLSGEDINADDFTFSIEDNNGWLAYDNSLLKDELIDYRAWASYSGQAGVGIPENPVLPQEIQTDAQAITSVKVAVAELTVGRLFVRDWTKYKRPMLIIRTADEGKLVASVPVIDYALLVKGEHYRQMSDQEYLDRADEYNMTFFLDKNNNWISTAIQVLSWRVVVDNTDLN